ncbi:protein FAM221A isoform X3 [Pitangus sulphuratus]|nr:protein FAM221A isoform X3 [Pitangus sulphuratus]
MERLQVEPEALEEYAEYRRIVGDDDGGKLFTPEEYEEYKRKVLPIRLQNRLYVSWRSPTGMDCSKCSGFHSCFTCACGQPAYAHETVVETKEERLAQGKPVGQDVPYAAMGGLTGFSSLAEGYMRLDDSGIGAPSAELLEAPITSMDHPFLKAFQGPSNSAQTISQGAGSSSATGQISYGKPSEEDDMAYFEKRYQERAS